MARLDLFPKVLQILTFLLVIGPTWTARDRAAPSDCGSRWQLCSGSGRTRPSVVPVLAKVHLLFLLLLCHCSTCGLSTSHGRCGCNREGLSLPSHHLLPAFLVLCSFRQAPCPPVRHAESDVVSDGSGERRGMTHKVAQIKLR